MTSEHTPGPWSIQPNGACFNLHSPDRLGHFGILVGMVSSNEGEHEANARLIAAAPDLLVACEAMVHAAKLNDPAMGGVAATLAHAAIAKAEQLPLTEGDSNDAKEGG